MANSGPNLAWPRRRRPKPVPPDIIESKCGLCDWTYTRHPRDGHRFTPEEHEAGMHSWQVAITHHFATEHPEHAP